MQTLKVLLVHRYFWPDSPPYASMLKCIAEELALGDRDITVFSTQPSYKKATSNADQPEFETVRNVKIIRKTLWGFDSDSIFHRLCNSILFLCHLVIHVIASPRYGVIVMSTVPQVFGPFVAALLARCSGARFIYHCQDIHPEVAVFGGLLTSKLICWLLLHIDNITIALAHKVVVVSDDMKLTLIARGPIREHKIIVISNFELPDFSGQEKSFLSLAPKRNKFRLLFAGNVGKFQKLDLIIDAMSKIGPRSDIELFILGDGQAKQALQEKVKQYNLDNVTFFGHQKLGLAKVMMREADLCLVTLAPNMYRVAFPSKTITILAQGSPILACLEKESSLASMVINNDLGFHVEMTNSDDIANVILRAYQQSSRSEDVRIICKSFYNVHFRTDNILNSWSDLIH